MPRKQFDILKDKCSRPFGLKNAGNVKKERSSRVLEALHLSDDAERLAGEPCQQNIVVGNLWCLNFGDVAVRGLSKVPGIRLLTIPINIA